MKKFKFQLAKAFVYSVGAIPLPILHMFGSVLGVISYCVPTNFRYYASTNIKICFPHFSFWRHQWFLLKSLGEIGKSIFEVPVFWTRTQQHLLKLVRDQAVLNMLVDASRGNKGIIILGAHLGGYYLNHAVASYCFPEGIGMYKPQKGMLGEIMGLLRHRSGGNFVPTTRQGVLKLFRHLKQAGAVGILCDHDVRGHGNVQAPFFNVEVSTMTLATKLANKTKAPVYMMIMERLAWGRGYRLHAWPVLEDIYNSNEQLAARAMNAEIEKAIKMFPTQHEWHYRRFRHSRLQNKPIYRERNK